MDMREMYGSWGGRSPPEKVIQLATLTGHGFSWDDGGFALSVGVDPPSQPHPHPHVLRAVGPRIPRLLNRGASASQKELVRCRLGVGWGRLGVGWGSGGDTHLGHTHPQVCAWNPAQYVGTGPMLGMDSVPLK